MHSGIFRGRQLVIFLFFLLSLTILLLRLFYIQALRHDFYYKIANEQHIVSTEVLPKRGTIFDRNMQVLAVNLNTDSVFANARIVKDKAQTAKMLAGILNLSEDFVYERLSRDKGFVWIKRKITPQESDEVKQKRRKKGLVLLSESNG